MVKTRPFEILEVDLEHGTTTIVISNGIIGAISKQLKDTSNVRKGANIIRKLGYLLSECGNVQYGSNKVSDTDIDPGVVRNE